jgi:RHS repeat-associated protein
LEASQISGFSYQAVENRVQVYLSGDTTAYHRVAIGDRWVEFRPLNVQGQAEVDSSVTGLAFHDAGVGVDLHYAILREGGLKEDIVLKSPQSLQKIQFQFRMKGLKFYKQPDTGQISFNDPLSDAPVLEIPQPFAIDSNGNQTTEIQTDVIDNGDTVLVSYSLPSDWLSAAKFPVLLDPTLTPPIQPSGDLAKDTWLESSVATQHGSDTTLSMGSKSTSPTFTSASAFVQFPLSSIPKGSSVSAASLVLTSAGGASATGLSYVTLNANQVFAPWQETSTSKPLTTTALGGVNVSYTAGTQPSYASASFTSLVQDWYTGAQENYGVELIVYPSSGWMQIYSSEAANSTYLPLLNITYTTPSFTKNNLYAGAPKAWEAGEGVTPWQVANLKNGNVLTSIPLFSWNCRGFPVGVTLYHNSMETDYGAYGLGWSHTYDQWVDVDPQNSSNRIYKAADGTRYTFTLSGTNTWDGPDGFPAKLTLSGSICTITFGDFSTETFQHLSIYGPATRSQLKSQRDPIGQTGVDLDYSNSSVITVTDTTQRSFSLRQAPSNSTDNVTELFALPGNISPLNWWNIYKTNGKLVRLRNPIDDVSNATGYSFHSYVFDYSADNAIIRIGDPNNNPSNSDGSNQNPVYTYHLDYGSRLQLLSAEGRYGFGKWMTTSGSVVTVTDSLGHFHKVEFDANGNVSRTINGLLNSTYYGWDSEHRLTSIRLPMDPSTAVDAGASKPFNTYEITYYPYSSKLNRMNVNQVKAKLLDSGKTTVMETHTTTYAYDSTGHNRVTQVTDPMNRTVKFVYDSTGWQRLLRVYDPKNSSTAPTGAICTIFQYDGGSTTGPGLLTQVTDTRGYVKRYAYTDTYQNLTAIKDPGDQSVTPRSFYTFSYNGDGTVQQRTDGRGWVTTYNYAWGGGLKSETVTLPNATNYATYQVKWTPNDQLKSVNGTLFTYDDLGNTTQDNNFSYTYNGMGDLLTRYHPTTGLQQLYTYDPLGRPKKTTRADGTTLETNDVYNNNEWLTKRTLGNGTYTTYTYDNLGRVTSLAHFKSTGVLLLQYDYTYNAADQITQVKENSSASVTYSYDENGRLNQEYRNDNFGGNWTYTYDNVGNRLTKSYNGWDGVGTIYYGYAYDATNRLTGYTGSGIITYDGNYNRTDYGFSYDEENRAVQTNSGALVWDWLDRRTNEGGWAVENDGNDRASVGSSTGLEIHHWGASPVGIEKSGATTWDHLDAQGTIRLTTDNSQNVVGNSAGVGPTAYGDENLSLTYPYDWGGAYGYKRQGNFVLMGVRVYEPDSGTFMQMDPVDNLGMSDYAYADGDPANEADPSGMQSIPDSSVSVNPQVGELLVGDSEAEGAAEEGTQFLRNARNLGRSGKQTRLRQLMNDDKVSRADRGWIKNEIRRIKFGNGSKAIRNPPGKVLAHMRGKMAKSGFSYLYSNLQDKFLHWLQHNIGGYRF